MKAVKYILLALAPVVLIVGLFLYMSGGDDKPRISSTVMLVDIVTGEVVVKDREDVVIVPSRNDRDGRPTLYPVFENEDGSIEIRDRFHDMLLEFAKNEKVAVDLKTFRVQGASK